jgi:hypothetical protein
MFLAKKQCQLLWPRSHILAQQIMHRGLAGLQLQVLRQGLS